MISRTNFALFALGALLFSALLYVAITYQILGWPSDTATDITPPDPRVLFALYTVAFGLPYALFELTRKINPLAILFAIILVPAVHYGAMYLYLWWTAAGQDMAAADPGAGTANAALIGGLIAGFAGAAVSFGLVFILRLNKAKGGLVVILAGLVLLTVCGGIGLKLLSSLDAPEPKDVILKLFLPWQLIFAFFLSALLRPSPKRGEVAATTD